MNPQLGREMAGTRIADMTRNMEITRAVKEARSNRRADTKQTPPTQGRYVPAGALRLGRALRRLRSKPAQAVTC
jgi:hypothetical protein